jgi:DNA invertase Pin-like site-specific DNA recombinase
MSPDRFGRDMTVQLAGHDLLKREGITLVPATAPDHFTEHTPTAVLVRQVLGAIAQFEKAPLVARMKVAKTLQGGRRRSTAPRDRRRPHAPVACISISCSVSPAEATRPHTPVSWRRRDRL